MIVRGWRGCFGIALLGLLALPASAPATFPGYNGKLAFVGLHTVNPDGSGATRITPSGFFGEWSPDGARIAFADTRDGNWEVYVVNADGSGAQRLTTNPARDWHPSWSPDGQQIVFETDRDGNAELYVMNADGSAPTRITNTSGIGELRPEWSPSGTRIAFDDGLDIYTIRPDGTDLRFAVEGQSQSWAPNGKDLWSWFLYYDEFLEDYYTGFQTVNVETGAYTTSNVGGHLAEPVVSPDGEALVYTTLGGSQTYVEDSTGSRLIGNWGAGDWQPLPVNSPSTHVRPAGASPFRVPLVPAARECTSGNRTHGPPLVYPSCSPPAPGSPHLTVGVGDGSPALSRSVGFMRIAIWPGTPGGADDSDGRVQFSLSNVMRTSDLSEYTGELRASLQVRLTDREGTVAQTGTLPLEFDVPCVPTAEPLDKSFCSLNTTLDSVMPGAAGEGTRAVWGLDQVKVYDGGPDEDADTTAGNSLFAVQGVFVP